MLEGVRAELGRNEVRGSLRRQRYTRQVSAALGWLTIETSLGNRVQRLWRSSTSKKRRLGRSAVGAAFRPLSSERLRVSHRGDAVALAIIERGRQRLSRFRHRDGAAVA